MHAVVDEVLAGHAPAANLPATAAEGMLARILRGVVPRQKAGPPIHSSPSLNKLAMLLLGFGRPPAVTWAQQLLGVQPVDGRAITLLGVLQDQVLKRPVTDLAQEPAGQLNQVLGLVYWRDGQYGKADTFCRYAKANRR